MKWNKSVSVLSDGILRIACLPEGQEDVEPTFAVKEPGQFRPVSVRRQGKWFRCQAEDVRVSFVQDGKPFSAANLLVEWGTTKQSGTPLRISNAQNNRGHGVRSWRPGMLDEENLGGPFQSLDLVHEAVSAEGTVAYDPMKGFDSHVCSPAMLIEQIREAIRANPDIPIDDEPWFREWRNYLAGKPPEILKEWPKQVRDCVQRIRKFPPGLLSRSGLTVLLDDSLPWDPKESWVPGEQPRTSTVLYVVRYGSDYKKAVGLLTKLLGPIPEAPDWVLGVWFSCYREMGERDYAKEKAEFDRHGLPLDVVVVDTDWHKLFWHGFDWNKKLFPNPERFAKWLRANGIRAAFNVHPTFIPENDTRLPEFLKRTGVPRNILTMETAPPPPRFFAGCQRLNLFDKKQAMAYFGIFHKPIERQGCDIWWIDGVLVHPTTGRDATPWLNEMYATYTNRRPGMPQGLVLSRAHGLGAHRSTLLFTGDTHSQWAVLAQEAEMVAKSANSLMAYVSHDIGAFFGGSPDWKKNQPPDDLYTRWVQFGCLGPMMRPHSDHGIREPWKFGKRAFEIMRTFFLLRKALQPYFVQLSKEAHRTGVSLCRPMYYEFPEDEEAYSARWQYMLGSAMLVAPVVTEDGFVTMWIPKGVWHHAFVDRTITGPATIRERVPLDHAPVYIREGAEIPWRAVGRRSGAVQRYRPGKLPLIAALGLARG